MRTFTVDLDEDTLASLRSEQEIKERIAQDIANQIVSKLKVSVEVSVR